MVAFDHDYRLLYHSNVWGARVLLCQFTSSDVFFLAEMWCLKKKGTQFRSPIAKTSCWLVVWNMNFMTFHSVGNVVILTFTPSFFRGVETQNYQAVLDLLGPQSSPRSLV